MAGLEKVHADPKHDANGRPVCGRCGFRCWEDEGETADEWPEDARLIPPPTRWRPFKVQLIKRERQHGGS